MKAALLIVIAMLIAGCVGGTGGFNSNPLVAPPWEAFVRAGPGAEGDVDLETLNGPTRIVLDQPQPDVAQIAEPPSSPEKPENPNAVAIKAVAVVPVQGGSDKANGELTAAMRYTLRKAGWPVLEAPRADALTIAGHIQLAKPKGGLQTVTLKWDVSTPQGKSLGDLSQSNNVPQGSLDKGWGENATYAAQAASDGIFKLIEGYR
jgi:hypothetical protein